MRPTSESWVRGVAGEQPPYLPRGHARPFLYAFQMEMYRQYVLAWHRRFGKSRTVLNAAWPKVMQRGWPVWHGFPEFAQGRDVFWNAVDSHTGRRILDDVLPYTSRVNDQRMILWFGDIYYQVMGFDRYNARVGAGPKVIIYDEWSLMDPMARNYFRPMVMENQGIEVFAFTLRGENHAAGLIDTAKAYPAEYFLSELTIDDTVRDAPGEQDYGQAVVTQEDVEHERRLFRASGGKMGMSEEMIQQEFYNSREGVNVGKVYGKEMAAARREGRIAQIPHDPTLLVHTAWDRGVHNRIWFWQQRGPARYYIDFLSTDNSALPDIVAQMREGHRAKYRYGDHWVARDAEDPTPWHEKSGTALAEGLGINFKIVARLSVLSGIDRAKAQLAMSWFDAKRCEEGLNDLREYEHAKSAKHGTFLKEPDRKQMAAHGADAFRYSAICDDAPVKPSGSPQLPAAPGHWQGV